MQAASRLRFRTWMSPGSHFKGLIEKTYGLYSKVSHREATYGASRECAKRRKWLWRERVGIEPTGAAQGTSQRF